MSVAAAARGEVDEAGLGTPSGFTGAEAAADAKSARIAEGTSMIPLLVGRSTGLEISDEEGWLGRAAGSGGGGVETARRPEG